MQTTRHTLVLTAGQSSGWVRDLGCQAWSIATALPTHELRRTLDANVLTCVVVDFTHGFNSDAHAALERLLALPNVGAVGLVAAGQLEDPLVRHLAVDHCLDVLSTPASPAQLTLSIAYAFDMLESRMHERDIDGNLLLRAGLKGGHQVHAEGSMIGSCEAMVALFRSIRKVARTDAPVFISGESGTGKELTAHEIHERSARRDRPFVVINCGAIPPHLLQSELFGYERGAFTGANQRKIGRVEAATGGTLFLDEIGDLPFESQASLLRFLQEKKLERIGGNQLHDIDVRIIAATHIDMPAAIESGRFRADLFHRLCVLRIDEPPLRARGTDIELLARRMLDRYRSDSQRTVRGFAPDAIAALYTYPWPGNVRELINRVRRAIVMSERPFITADDLDLGDYADRSTVSLAEAREEADRDVIQMALLRNRGSLSKAAIDLRISRVTLTRLLRARGMSAANFKSSRSAR
ncbi:sigma-54 dependent transcriptional regulator [Paraburkholderia megapolitana]|uniref:sigma-54 dependent transcriptional regulator n=1 Tax=Paraburkholderia megapolitana TaxID=420953 RepID=UPI0038BC5F2A